MPYKKPWVSSVLTDIQDQGPSPGKDVQNGDHGEEETATASIVHSGVQFLSLPSEWREKVRESAARGKESLPEVYRRNPIE